MEATTFFLIVLFVGSLVLVAFRLAFAAGRDALVARRILFGCGILIEIPALTFAWHSAAVGLPNKAGGTLALAFIGLIFIIAAKLYPTD